MEVAVLLGVLVGVTVAVLLAVEVKVKVQVWPELSVQGVLVTVKVLVAAGAAGLEGVLLLEGQPRVKKATPIKSENTPKMRSFMVWPFPKFKTLGQTNHLGKGFLCEVSMRAQRLNRYKISGTQAFFRAIKLSDSAKLELLCLKRRGRMLEKS